jgi:endonuclease/exonuclease/phosphatase (EEP) superfamily protein YafD
MKTTYLHIFELQQKIHDSPLDRNLRTDLDNHPAECAECVEIIKLSVKLQNAARYKFSSVDRDLRSDAQMIDAVKKRYRDQQLYRRLFGPLPGFAWITIGIMLVALLSWGIVLLRPKSNIPMASSTQLSTSTPSPTGINQVTNNCHTISYTINQRDTLLAIAIYFNVPLGRFTQGII